MESTVTITIYQFGEFRLIPAEGLLLRDGQPVSLNPKAFAVLVMLVERHGHLVSKSEMIDSIWDGAFVEEGAVAKSVWFVRSALGDSAKEHYIQTIPRRGYRFIAPVTVSKGSGAYRLSALPGIQGISNEYGPDGKQQISPDHRAETLGIEKESLSEPLNAVPVPARVGSDISKYLRFAVVFFLLLSAMALLTYVYRSYKP